MVVHVYLAEESVEESLEWIAAMAWNAAIKSAKASRYEEAAKNFRAAARIPRFKRWQSTVQSVNLCLLLSASAFLLSLENGDHHTNSMENMLQRTEQTLADVDLHEEPESAKLKEFADMLAFELECAVCFNVMASYLTTSASTNLSRFHMQRSEVTEGKRNP